MAEGQEKKAQEVSDTTVHAIPGHATAQDALEAALFQGQVYHDAGYMVGPPWYVPVPVRGTYPLEYTYEGRIWYGTSEDALMSRFYSHLHELEQDAVDEALGVQEELRALGYEVGSVGADTRTFDGRTYYESVFYFGMPGIEVPEPFPEQARTHWGVWALTASLALTTIAIIAIGTRKK